MHRLRLLPRLLRQQHPRPEWPVLPAWYRPMALAQLPPQAQPDSPPADFPAAVRRMEAELVEPMAKVLRNSLRHWPEMSDVAWASTPVDEATSRAARPGRNPGDVLMTPQNP